jgi:hypothetical protein
MAREAPRRGGQFIKGGWGFHGPHIYSRVFLVLRWMMIEKVHGVALWGWPFLVAKPLWGRYGWAGLLPTLT